MKVVVENRCGMVAVAVGGVWWQWWGIRVGQGMGAGVGN